MYKFIFILKNIFKQIRYFQIASSSPEDYFIFRLFFNVHVPKVIKIFE
jgi:hypothetical protein